MTSIQRSLLTLSVTVAGPAGATAVFDKACCLLDLLTRPGRAAQVEKAPTESYADVGGLEQQIQEIKEAVELPLTHPELYEDIGIKPPKVRLMSLVANKMIVKTSRTYSS